MELVADRLWLAADGGVKPFDGDMSDYAKFVLDRARVAARAPSQVVAPPPPPPPPRPSGRDPAALIGPLKRKLEAAEATLARETRTAAELDALLANPKLYLNEPDRAADMGRRRERIQEALERAEAAWMAAAEAYEAAKTAAGV